MDRSTLLIKSWLNSSAPLRLSVASALTLVAIYIANQSHDILSAGHLQFILLAMVLLAAWLSGLLAGLIGATLGFGLMLWRAVEDKDEGWTLDFQAVFDAFLWFAFAKLMAAVIAGPRHRLRRLAESQRRAEANASQKEILLGELSHRTNNDLQRLVALLHSQAASDPGAADALRIAASRVQVLRRVHERLSQRDAGATVDSRIFIEGLVKDLRATVDGMRPIALTVRVESHALSVMTASDVGLIVNELVTNALKHAFPPDREGLIRVTFGRDESFYELAVTDNGIGSTADARLARAQAGGEGTRLLRALATQLGGRLDLMEAEVGGTQCRLRFPVQPPNLSTGIAATAAEQQLGPVPGEVIPPTQNRSAP